MHDPIFDIGYNKTFISRYPLIKYGEIKRVVE